MVQNYCACMQIQKAQKLIFYKSEGKPFHAKYLVRFTMYMYKYIVLQTVKYGYWDWVWDTCELHVHLRETTISFHRSISFVLFCFFTMTTKLIAVPRSANACPAWHCISGEFTKFGRKSKWLHALHGNKHAGNHPVPACAHIVDTCLHSMYRHIHLACLIISPRNCTSAKFLSLVLCMWLELWLIINGINPLHQLSDICTDMMERVQIKPLMRSTALLICMKFCLGVTLHNTMGTIPCVYIRQRCCIYHGLDVHSRSNNHLI